MVEFKHTGDRSGIRIFYLNQSSQARTLVWCPICFFFPLFIHTTTILFNGCVYCMNDFGGIWLKICKKVVYMGYRKFLRAYHPYRRNKKVFDWTIKNRRAPKIGNKYF
jgi:hypothetical protein